MYVCTYIIPDVEQMLKVTNLYDLTQKWLLCSVLVQISASIEI